MTKIPTELKYTNDHEWLKIENEVGIIGITDYAQESLGDITFVELPSPGDSLAKGDAFGVVESVKAASDLYSPVAGEVIEVNDALEDAPETVNEAPYVGGWIMKVRLDSDTLDGLLDADAYQATLSADD